MQKTKEIDVWVDILDEEMMEYISNVRVDGYHKAKLIIELPEKKVEITESDFDPILEYFSNSEDKHVVKIVKEKLGF